MHEHGIEPQDLNSTVPGLFKRPVQKDWIFLLSLIAVVAGVSGTISEYGNFRTFNSSDWLAFSIDVGIGAGIQAAIFGIVPAVWRRKRQDKKGIKTETTYMKTGRYWCLVFGLAIGYSLFVSVSKNSSINGATTDWRCESVGQDRICVQGTYMGERRASLRMAREYGAVQMIGNAEVAKLEWGTTLDCNLAQGHVNYLMAYDLRGNISILPSFERQKMMDGIQRDQVDANIQNLCASL